MKTVMITGAGGFIGRNLSKALLNLGYKVYGVDVCVIGLRELEKETDFVSIEVDSNNFNALDDYDLADIDMVYHLGWAGQLGGHDLNDYDLQISNVNMTKSLIDKLLEKRLKKFIFCGSISHYKYMNDVNEQINSDIYGLAKKFAGDMSLNMMKRNNIDCHIALLANTYGVGDQSNKAVNTMIRKFHTNEELLLISGETPNDWVYIDDTVQGLIAIGEKGVAYRQYYIGHQIVTCFRDNLEALKDVMNSDMELKFGTYKDVTYADYSKVDLDSLYHDTGFLCQCDLKESLLKTAQWLIKKDKGE